MDKAALSGGSYRQVLDIETCAEGASTLISSPLLFFAPSLLYAPLFFNPLLFYVISLSLLFLISRICVTTRCDARGRSRSEPDVLGAGGG
jgi:hypothetical protein